MHQGERPAGYVWNAWAKGYKLGVQSSSDHVSTHSSYACILVEDFSRQGLVDAMRKRHTYAATDSIVMDLRASDGRGHLPDGRYLRDEVAAEAGGEGARHRADQADRRHQEQHVRLQGESRLRRPRTFEYVDTAIAPGENYYYVRAEQTDGQLAWASPVWVKYSK